ncbi:MAG: CBS domain-containing protein [Archangium sp.]|nr:CBS domain-containing protein [Archangium sp.]
MQSTAAAQIEDWVKAGRRKNGHSTELCGLVSDSPRCLDAELEASRGLSLLDAAGLSSAPVVDDNGVLVGVVFLSTLARLREVKELEIEDAMVTDAVTVAQGASVAEVARLMSRHGLDRLPVTTPDGHLLGVISAMDVMRWLAERLPA